MYKYLFFRPDKLFIQKNTQFIIWYANEQTFPNLARVPVVTEKTKVKAEQNKQTETVELKMTSPIHISYDIKITLLSSLIHHITHTSMLFNISAVLPYQF